MILTLLVPTSYLGSLEIHLHGLDTPITIPNDVLVVPDEWTSQSGTTEYNSSTAVLLFSPIDEINANDPLILGMNFFSAAYLTVNLDNGTWSIWPAKAARDVRLVGISDDGSENEDREKCGSRGSASLTENDKPRQGEAVQDQVSETTTTTTTKLSISAIAGIATGAGCVVLGSLALLIWCILTSKRRKARQLLYNPPPDLHNSPTYNPNHGPYNELETSIFGHKQVQEMMGSQMDPYELAHEVTPAEMAHHPRDNDRYYHRYGRRGQCARGHDGNDAGLFYCQSPVELPVGRG